MPTAVKDNRKALIQVTGLAHRYGQQMLYRDVSFDVLAGEIFAILGLSGSGKSTLMKQLIGLLPESEGEIEILGQYITGPNKEEGLDRVRRQIGVMFQNGALFGSMTLLENVMLPLEMWTSLPVDARALVARYKLGLVGLADAAEQKPAEISGGMVKRAAIARAMALDPPILFLDEPAGGLDPITSAGLDRLILELRLNQGTTFVVVTHELASLLTIADRCIMLDRSAHEDCGGIIAEGDPKVLRQDSKNSIVRAFLRRELPPTRQPTAGRAGGC